jgi:hypothetical protein
MTGTMPRLRRDRIGAVASPFAGPRACGQQDDNEMLEGHGLANGLAA